MRLHRLVKSHFFHPEFTRPLERNENGEKVVVRILQRFLHTPIKRMKPPYICFIFLFFCILALRMLDTSDVPWLLFPLRRMANCWKDVGRTALLSTRSGVGIGLGLIDD